MSDTSKPTQSIPGHRKYTILDLRTEFPDDVACLRYLMESRWPDCRLDCDKCKVERKHYPVSGRTAFACEICGNHVYPLVGTIFEKSSTSLTLWFHAMFLMGSSRCGVSAKQLQREIGVTYKTAWRMMKQIRTLMTEDLFLDKGSVEMDETYVGGRSKNRRLGKRGGVGRSLDHKTTVFGMVERGGRVYAQVTPNAKARTILPIVAERVLPKSTVYTDDYPIYDSVRWMGKSYHHKRINHAEKVYVMGDIHTNTIEGFWSLVKRGLAGTYHSVSKHYLQSYLDEYSFRYNRRNANDPMFVSLLERVSELAE